MFRRFLPVASAFLAASVLAVPTYAKTHVVFQKSSLGSVYATAAVTPAHRYQVQVTSAKGHVKFTASLSQYYTYALKKSFMSGNKAVLLSGTTPKSFTFAQPIKTKLLEWLMTIGVTAKTTGKVTVKYVDLGAQK